jgi:hypothetical protein
LLGNIQLPKRRRTKDQKNPKLDWVVLNNASLERPEWNFTHSLPFQESVAPRTCHCVPKTNMAKVANPFGWNDVSSLRRLFYSPFGFEI